jgi:hypothetical protein
MFEKYFILLITFLCSVDFGYGQTHVNYPQDGIYGGIESGVAFVRVYGTYRINISKIDSEEFISKDYTKSVISINLGYGKYLGESFIGIEAHHSLYTKKISDAFVQRDINFDISITSKSEIDLILGRKIGIKSLLTLRGGIAFSNINVVVDNNLGNEIYALDKQWNGFSLGMGYIYGINENLSIKSKYNLTAFKNKKNPQTNSKLVDNRATLSLIYRIWN